MTRDEAYLNLLMSLYEQNYYLRKVGGSLTESMKIEIAFDAGVKYGSNRR